MSLGGRWAGALLVATMAAVAIVACSAKDSTSNGGAGNDGSAIGADGGTGGDEAGEPATVLLDPGTPASAPRVFAEPDVAGAGPCLYEPQIGSLIPKNWGRMRFRQKATQGENLFEIKLVVPNQKHPLVIYTTKESYALDTQVWSTWTGPIQVSVRSATVDAQGNRTGGPWLGSTGGIEIAPVEARGTLSYFSTSDIAVKQFRIGDEGVTPGPTKADGGKTCIGCHAPTPDGIHAALTLDVPNGGIVLRPLAGGTTEPTFLSTSGRNLLARANQFAASFSKGRWADGDRIAVSMYQSPSTGKTEIIWTNLEATSTAQGTGWDVFARTGDSGWASSATVSHDGTKIAYVSTSNTQTGVRSTNGKIGIIPWNARAGGAVTFVVDTSAVSYYPSFSADDTLLAFAQASSGSTYNNPNSELFVVPAVGGTPLRLAANDPPACSGVTSPGITNSWPRWSTEAQTSGGKTYHFIAFSSTRLEKRKIFIAPVVVEGTTITSYPALYPWNQPETGLNHTPQWSESP